METGVGLAFHRRTHLSLTPEIREAHEATTGTSRFAGNYSIFKSQQVKQTRLTEGLEHSRNYWNVQEVNLGFLIGASS